MTLKSLGTQIPTCNLCGRSETSFLFRPVHSPGPVVQCKHCGLMYISPIEESAHIVSEALRLDEIPPAVRMSSDIQLLEHRWEKRLIDNYMKEFRQKSADAHALLAAIEEFVPGGRILDVGCGPGLLLAAAKGRGWEPYGIEPLVGFAIFARGHFGLSVVNDLLREDTFPRDFFDAAVMNQVLEHVTDPLGGLKLLHSFIRPQGIVEVDVPSIGNLWARLLRGNYRHFVEDHLTFFSPITLRQMLEKAGFKVVKQGYCSRTISLRSLLIRCLRNVRISDEKCRRADRLASRLHLGEFNLSIDLHDITYAFALK